LINQLITEFIHRTESLAMVSTDFQVSLSATSLAAISNLSILIYLVIIVNIYPEDDLHQTYIGRCYAKLLTTQASEARQNQGPLAPNVSDATKRLFEKCIDSIPADNLPSVSEAIDHWRGVSAVVMAVPTGSLTRPPASRLVRFPLPRKNSVNQTM
jgi:hypothetical protein